MFQKIKLYISSTYRLTTDFELSISMDGRHFSCWMHICIRGLSRHMSSYPKNKIQILPAGALARIPSIN
jgi:hypothetical protein